MNCSERRVGQDSLNSAWSYAADHREFPSEARNGAMGRQIVIDEGNKDMNASDLAWIAEFRAESQ